MTRADDRIRMWLQSRGWAGGYFGWTHPDLHPLAGNQMGLGLAEAYHRQNAADRVAATDNRNADIREADLGIDDEWRREAIGAIRRVAERQPELTTDDVLAAAPDLELTVEPRAWGPVMLYAAKDGLIAPTDRYAPSSRRQSNARHKRVWRSLICGGAAPRPDVTADLDVLEAVAM